MIKPEAINDVVESARTVYEFRSTFHDRLDPMWIYSDEAKLAQLYYQEGWKACMEMHGINL